MKNAFQRFILMTAALDFTGRELNDVIRTLQTMSARDLEFLIFRVQDAARSISSLENTRPRSSLISSHANIASRVERLLKTEADLTTSSAYDSLRKALIGAGLITKREMPPLSKKSFHSWVTRLAEVIPPKEILRIATIIRNEHTHDAPTDWALGDREP